MFFPYVFSLLILSSFPLVYAYLNDTSNADLTWSGNSAHPLISNSSQWCYFPVANVTKNTACIGTSSSSASSYQTLINAHLNLRQGWSIAYYALDSVALLGDFRYPVPAKGVRMCLSGQALDKSYQTYCRAVYHNNDIVDNASDDWCVVALGQSYVSDGCYTTMASSGIVRAVTTPAKTVTAPQNTATSAHSKAQMLQDCVPGCGKSQCTFSNLSHVSPVTYPIIVGIPVDNCDPKSRTTISTGIGGSVEIIDTWSVNTTLGVGYKGLSLSVQGSYSHSKAITYSQTITIQVPPGQRGALVANVLFNRTSGNMKIGSGNLFPIISNQPQEVVSYGQQITLCNSQFAATNSSAMVCSSGAALSPRKSSLLTFFALLIPIFALMV